MASRAEPSGRRLNEHDARVVKGMLERGDRQHDIAAWFGVNGGRVAEVATGKRFRCVAPAGAGDLPPPGPYPSGQEAAEAQAALEKALGALAAVETALTKLRYSAHPNARRTGAT